MKLEKNVDSPGYTLKGHRYHINVRLEVSGDANVQDDYQMRADIEHAIVKAFNREWSNDYGGKGDTQARLYHHPRAEEDGD